MKTLLKNLFMVIGLLLLALIGIAVLLILPPSMPVAVIIAAFLLSNKL